MTSQKGGRITNGDSMGVAYCLEKHFNIYLEKGDFSVTDFLSDIYFNTGGKYGATRAEMFGKGDDTENYESLNLAEYISAIRAGQSQSEFEAVETRFVRKKNVPHEEVKE